MNKEIYKTEIGKVKDIIINENSIKIEADKTLILSSYHDSYCCETVYADFSDIKYHIEEIKAQEVKELIIKSVEKIGFLLCFEIKYDKSIKIFIPCYNYQNGFYSDNLTLQIDNGGVKTEIDITNLVEDHIA